MKDLYFGKTVGAKFNEDGSVRRYPGNTIISLLDPNTEVFARIQHARESLKRSAIGRCITTLPDISLHMTAIEGVCDQVRRPELWTSRLPLDAPLEAVDDLFEREWGHIPPLGRVEMTFSHLRIGGGVGVGLVPSHGDDNQRIRAWRDTVGQHLGLRFPGHDTYEFHISLAYGIYVPTREEQDDLLAWKEAFDHEYALKVFTFVVPEPSLTFFDSMFFFDTKRIVRH